MYQYSAANAIGFPPVDYWATNDIHVSDGVFDFVHKRNSSNSYTYHIIVTSRYSTPTVVLVTVS